MTTIIKDLKTATLLGTCLSRDYAGKVLRLLAAYRSLSASELASRLDLHIQTAQDFLEALAELGIAGREEVLEKKRPYFRYSLPDPRLRIEIDLTAALAPTAGAADPGRIREKKNAAVRFGIGRDGASISHVTVWTGKGREQRERRINLTRDQGRFLFHLPFPTAEHATVEAIMKRAGVEDAAAAGEILDLLEWLDVQDVIDHNGGK